MNYHLSIHLYWIIKMKKKIKIYIMCFKHFKHLLFSLGLNTIPLDHILFIIFSRCVMIVIITILLALTEHSRLFNLILYVTVLSARLVQWKPPWHQSMNFTLTCYSNGAAWRIWEYRTSTLLIIVLRNNKKFLSCVTPP